MPRPDPERWLAQWRVPDRFVAGDGGVAGVAKRPRLPKPGNRLVDRAPKHVLDEWDAERNLPVTPETVGASSTWAAWWRCAQVRSHIWQQCVNQRALTAVHGTCPQCAIETAIDERRGHSDESLAACHPARVRSFSPENPLQPEDASAAAQWSWLWVCDVGHRYVATLDELKGGFRCGGCWVRQRWESRLGSAGVRRGGVFRLDRPRQRSKEELKLAAELAVVFPVDLENDGLRVAGFVGDQPFVTPDVLIPPLRAAVEWDGGGHRRDPSLDREKDALLSATGWTTIRAVYGATGSDAHTVAAPTGLTLAVVAEVMSRLIGLEARYADAVSSWRDVGRWQGGQLYEALVNRHGHLANGRGWYRRKS